MQSFQFRVLHRIVTCNHLLHRWRIKDSGTCSYCDQEDTLEHFFYSCQLCRTFWVQVKNWLHANAKISLARITLKEFMLGVPKDHPQALVVNYILIWVKYFVHRQKLFGEGLLNLSHWKRELRLKLLAERKICAIEGKAGKFKRWEILLASTEV